VAFKYLFNSISISLSVFQKRFISARILKKGTLAGAKQLVQSRFKYPADYKEKMQQSYKPGSVS